MSMMGTLAKLAIGYAAARGVDHLTGGKGMMGGARVAPGKARAKPAPGMGQVQDMMSSLGGGAGMASVQDMLGQLTGGGAGGLADMQKNIAAMAKQSGFDLSAILGGAPDSAAKGGLLSSQPEAGPGLAGVLAALGGAAAAGGTGTAQMIDQFKTAQAAPQAEEAAGLMLRAMIQAAKSDGEIDKAEQQKIMETLGDDADAEDIAFIRAQLAAPVDVEALAAATPAPLAAQVYSMSLMAIRLDRQGEADYLDDLARALGLNQQMVNTLHLQMGVQPLYG
ncbi:tellurite resistance TerB family protein [Pukyongiella litopenaei]|uniref:Tellurite resistance TerB family protein n=1 Tax=Pukyongiella litopenaei TaxID=2605946 RepID=A0A2S0MUH6_9RHOB|nr:tellurite resistance TerB family protein [Pukyongiella litopenaei]AVO39528.1 tellurite resistance TerB family protein [Pukyongiella litopenaei]